MKKVMANSQLLVVDQGNVAHLPRDKGGCPQPGPMVTVAQALVWLKPMACFRCMLDRVEVPW